MTTKNIYTSLFLISVLTLSVSAIAATDAENENKSDSAPSVSKTSLDNIIDKSQTPAARSDNTDELITNNNLRALTGSKSKWSISSQFEYLGSAINTPFAEDRPNIAGASGTTNKADLDGQVSVKYKFNATNSLNAGLGVRWIAPLATKGPTNYSGNTYDASNPYLMYQNISKIFGVQTVLQVQGLQWTQSDYTQYGFDKQVLVQPILMYEVPGTKLSVGAATWYQYQTFNKQGSVGEVSNVEDIQADAQIGFAPIVEYQLTDKYNLRTVSNLWVFEHYRSQADSTVYSQDKITQSVGVGISITRDIFLYPNVQFLPEQIASELTNVGIQATINMF